MDIIVTYDIKRNHTEIRNELKTLGYKDSIVGAKLSDNSPAELLMPKNILLKYGDLSVTGCRDEVIAIIKKYKGGLNCIFCAVLEEGFIWCGV